MLIAMRLIRLVVATFLAVGAFCLLGAPAHAHERCTFLDESAVNGPCYVLQPSSGPVGTRVHFRVRVPPQYQGGWLSDWRCHPSLRMFKRVHSDKDSHCVFIVSSQPSHWHVVRLEPHDPDAAVNEKAVVGWLTVGDVGRCEGGKTQRVTPDRYYLSTSSRHGAFARFRVSPQVLPHTGIRDLQALTLLGSLLVLTGYALSRRRAPRQ